MMGAMTALDAWDGMACLVCLCRQFRVRLRLRIYVLLAFGDGNYGHRRSRRLGLAVITDRERLKPADRTILPRLDRYTRQYTCGIALACFNQDSKLLDLTSHILLSSARPMKYRREERTSNLSLQYF